MYRPIYSSEKYLNKFKSREKLSCYQEESYSEDELTARSNNAPEIFTLCLQNYLKF